MKSNKILITIFAFLLSVFVFTSCSKEENDDSSFDTKAIEYVGEYQIESVLWSGNSLDFNLDGKFHNELTNELTNFPNYNIKEYITVISVEKEARKDSSYLQINANLPYPDFRKKNEEITLSSINYVSQNFSVKNVRGLIASFEIKPNVLNITDSSELFLSNISEVNIESINKEEIKIRMKCKMFDLTKNKQEENYLHYCFRKLNK